MKKIHIRISEEDRDEVDIIVVGEEVVIAGSIRQEDPAKIMEKILIRRDLDMALAEIGEKEANIVRMRYGLNGKTPMTLNDIAKKMKLSRERIRQIEERALLRLRRVAARMGLVESSRYSIATIQPGWTAPKLKTDILGDAIPQKPYLPKKK